MRKWMQWIIVFLGLALMKPPLPIGVSANPDCLSPSSALQTEDSSPLSIASQNEFVHGTLQALYPKKHFRQRKIQSVHSQKLPSMPGEISRYKVIVRIRNTYYVFMMETSTTPLQVEKLQAKAHWFAQGKDLGIFPQPGVLQFIGSRAFFSYDYIEGISLSDLLGQGLLTHTKFEAAVQSWLQSARLMTGLPQGFRDPQVALDQIVLRKFGNHILDRAVLLDCQPGERIEDVDLIPFLMQLFNALSIQDICPLLFNAILEAFGYHDGMQFLSLLYHQLRSKTASVATPSELKFLGALERFIRSLPREFTTLQIPHMPVEQAL